MKNMYNRYRVVFTVAAVVAILISTFVCPGVIAASPPDTPYNISPAEGATDISLAHTFRASPFSDIDLGEKIAYYQWQITTTKGDYTNLVYDSEVLSSPAVVSIEVPLSDPPVTIDYPVTTLPQGNLHPNTVYYWHVRYYDDTGLKSDWSPETSFKTIASGPPGKPQNLYPANEAADIPLDAAVIEASVFVSPDGGATHKASLWQITTTPGIYTTPVFDTGIDSNNLEGLVIPAGTLRPNTIYYWRVQYQDNFGNWSNWSTETSFKTIVVPVLSDVPENIYPVNAAAEISLDPSLESSPFVSNTEGATHVASQWQITDTAGKYTAPVFDSGIDSENLTTVAIRPGNLKLNTIYYWRVRYQDNSQKWSAWSAETYFKTIASGVPSKPVNLAPFNGAVEIMASPTLAASQFVSPNGGAVHMASRWQITAVPGDYTSTIYDSEIDTGNLTSITVPDEELNFGTKYYWHVKYQDNLGSWSEWSAESSFTTLIRPPEIPVNVSPVDEATGISLAPTLGSSPYSSTSGAQKAAQWQITTVKGNYTEPVFDSGISAVALNTVVVPSGKLAYGVTYYWHVKYQDSNGLWSDWSEETYFVTGTQPPAAPKNGSPMNGATGFTATPSLTGSVFTTGALAVTHRASQWQITATSGDYAKTVYDSGTSTSYKTSITVPPGKLSYSTKYYWRVRYQDSNMTWSDWSAETSFTTAAQPVTPSTSITTTTTTSVPTTPASTTTLTTTSTTQTTTSTLTTTTTTSSSGKILGMPTLSVIIGGAVVILVIVIIVMMVKKKKQG